MEVDLVIPICFNRNTWFIPGKIISSEAEKYTENFEGKAEQQIGVSKVRIFIKQKIMKKNLL